MTISYIYGLLLWCAPYKQLWSTILYKSLKVQNVKTQKSNLEWWTEIFNILSYIEINIVLRTKAEGIVFCSDTDNGVYFWNTARGPISLAANIFNFASSIM